MLRRKTKKSDSQSNGSFSYSRVEASNSLQEESILLPNSVNVDVAEDDKPVSWSAEEKKIFEDQLESLQEQLIATMMDNQKLGVYIFRNCLFTDIHDSSGPNSDIEG